MLLDIFNELDLGQMEMEIYLHLVQKGGRRASQIALELEEPKSNILERLYTLESAGLVSRTEVKNYFIFQAIDPGILDFKLEQKQKNLRIMRSNLIKELAKLKRNQDSKLLPKVKYFEGREGIIAIFEETLKAKTEIYAYGDFAPGINYLGDYQTEYWRKRTRLRIPLKSFVSDNSFNQSLVKETDHLYLRTSYFHDKKYASPIEINVYDNKVIFISFDEEFGAMIESAQVAQAIRNILNMGARI